MTELGATRATEVQGNRAKSLEGDIDRIAGIEGDTTGRWISDGT